MIRLVIPYADIAPLNRIYAAGHWSTRKKAADRAHQVVWAAAHEQLGSPIEPFPEPAEVVIAAFACRPRDVDSYGKLVLDGLVIAGVLADDDYLHVPRLILEVHKVARAQEKIVVEILALQEA